MYTIFIGFVVFKVIKFVLLNYYRVKGGQNSPSAWLGSVRGGFYQDSDIKKHATRVH